MLTEETIEEFQCAISDNQHFLTEPIPLSRCGHSVCKKCLPNENVKAIKCLICGLVTNQDFSKTEVSNISQKAIKIHFNELFGLLEKETSLILDELKEKFNENEENFKIKYEFIEEDIDIRIESIKTEVDLVGKMLKEKLQKMKEDSFGTETKTKIESFGLSLQELQSNLVGNLNLNELYLEQYQTKMNELSELRNRIDQSNIPDICISTKKLTEDLIGEIYFSNELNINVRNLIKKPKQEIIKLEHKPYHLIALKYNQIICLVSHGLNLYDQDFKLIRRVSKINGKHIVPEGLAINPNTNLLYISELKNHKILITDFQFNFIKSFGSGQGTGLTQFNQPTDICYKNEKIYVSDSINKRVQIFNPYFVYSNTLKLDYNPKKLQASNSILCIRSTKESPGVYFYDLEKLNLIQKYNHGLCRISEINSQFYEFNSRLNILYCYNDNGDLKEEININRNDFNGCNDGCLVIFNGSVYMSSYKNKMLFKF